MLPLPPTRLDNSHRNSIISSPVIDSQERVADEPSGVDLARTGKPVGIGTMAFLIWETPEGAKTHRLETDVNIGRLPSNNIVFVDPHVSSVHARVRQDGQKWVFEDMGSTNGSLVNGKRQKTVALNEGDVMRIGPFDIMFVQSIPSPKADATPPSEKPSTATPGRRETSLRVEELFSDHASFATLTSLNANALQVPPAGLDTSLDPSRLTRRLHACYEISKATSAQLDLSGVMDKVLTALFEIFASADRVLILLMDAKTLEVKATAARGRSSDGTDRIAVSRTALEEAVRGQKAVLCLNAMEDQRYAAAQSIVSLGIRSLMIAPLVFRGESLGAIQIDAQRRAGQFTQADLELLSAAAAQVAGCVANAQLHEQVVKTERLAAVGQTVAGLSHCIKNILQGIQGGAYILEKGLRDDKVQNVKTGWEMVRRNNAFMEELVFDLLSYSKERAPEYAQTDLNSLCSDICSLVSARPDAKQMSIMFEPDPKLGSIEIDPKGIRRCVLNLATNAVDACLSTRGNVTVSTQSDGVDGYVRVRVRDSGCGMSSETKAKLFNVFFSTKGSKGTGLGLSVTRKIVEEHGGRIEVESEMGKGSTFILSLPKVRPSGQRAAVTA
jgi:two-component system, NtrC family, sensor kinase